MKDIYFGWATHNIGEDGMPCEEFTGWVASCFVLFTHVIFIGKVRWYEDD